MAARAVLFEILLERSCFCEKALRLQPASWSASKKACFSNLVHDSGGVQTERRKTNTPLLTNVNLQSMLVALVSVERGNEYWVPSIRQVEHCFTFIIPLYHSYKMSPVFHEWRRQVKNPALVSWQIVTWNPNLGFLYLLKKKFPW